MLTFTKLEKFSKRDTLFFACVKCVNYISKHTNISLAYYKHGCRTNF